MQNIAHLYSLPIFVWEATAALVNFELGAFAQTELEGALNIQWLQNQAAEVTGAAYALFALPTAYDSHGSQTYSPAKLKQFALELCTHATNAQLLSLHHTAEEAADLLKEFLKILAETAGSEYEERTAEIQNGQRYYAHLPTRREWAATR